MKNQEQKEEYARKAKQIEELLSHPDEVDLWALRELCSTEGGLINDSLRKKAWPKLVGLSNTLKDPPPLPPLHRKLPSKPKSKSKETTTTTTTVVTPASISHPKSASISVVDPTTVPSFKNQIMASCTDANQIALDIARCTWHLLNGSQRTRRNTMRNKHKKKIKALLKRKQKRLGNFINLTLIRSYGFTGNDCHGSGGGGGGGDDNGLNLMEKLRYYQGYHDVSCILLSALGGETRAPPKQASTDSSDAKSMHEKAIKTAQAMGLDLPTEVLVQLSQSHFKDMMKSNFENLTKALKLVVMPLLAALDYEVYQHLVDCDMEPYFCLSWIITWFSHDVRDTDLVKRLFDFFIASHPLMSIYVSVAMILHPHNRMEVLDADCDFACVHKALVDLPRNSCNVGWKFVGNVMGGGYVSGDEEDADGVSLDAGSLLSQDVYRDECMSFEDRSTASTVPSMSSDSFMSNVESCRVPFQELIDLAITFMRRIPPRKLMRLAHRHYDHETMQELASDADTIKMLQPPPTWALSSTIESDKAIKRRSRELKVKSRGKSCGSDTSTDLQEDSKSREVGKGGVAHESRYPHALIAAGIGPDGDGDVLRRKRRRKLLRNGAIIFGFVAILCGLVKQDVLDAPIMFRSYSVTMISKDLSSTARKPSKLNQSKKVKNEKSPSQSKPAFEPTMSIIREIEKFEIVGEKDIVQHILKEDDKDIVGGSPNLDSDRLDKVDDDDSSSTDDSGEGNMIYSHEKVIQKVIENIDRVTSRPDKEVNVKEAQKDSKRTSKLLQKSDEMSLKLELISSQPSEFYPVGTGSVNYIVKYVEGFLSQISSLELNIQETRRQLEAISGNSYALGPVDNSNPGNFIRNILDEAKVALESEAEAIFL